MSTTRETISTTLVSFDLAALARFADRRDDERHELKRQRDAGKRQACRAPPGRQIARSVSGERRDVAGDDSVCIAGDRRRRAVEAARTSESLTQAVEKLLARSARVFSGRERFLHGLQGKRERDMHVVDWHHD